MTTDRPSLGLAFGSALSVLAMLVAGQIFFPAKEFSVQTVELDSPIHLSGPDADEALAQDGMANIVLQPHQVMRLPSDTSGDDSTVDRADGARSPETSSEDEVSSIAGPTVATAAPSDTDLFGDGAPSTANDETAAITTADPKSATTRERIVSLLGGKLSLDINKYPILGSPDAPYVVVEMISYDCPHCRKMHRIVEKARKRYGDELAVVILPVPLEKSCNKYVTSNTSAHRNSCTLARYAIAVSQANPKAFKKFHDWIMADEEKAPPIAKVIDKANSLVNGDRLRKIKNSDRVKAEIAHNVELFATLQNQHRTNRSFGLPVQIVGNGVMSGVATEDAISDMWEERLGIKPL